MEQQVVVSMEVGVCGVVGRVGRRASGPPIGGALGQHELVHVHRVHIVHVHVHQAARAIVCRKHAVLHARLRHHRARRPQIQLHLHCGEPFLSPFPSRKNCSSKTVLLENCSPQTLSLVCPKLSFQGLFSTIVLFLPLLFGFFWALLVKLKRAARNWNIKYRYFMDQILECLSRGCLPLFQLFPPWSTLPAALEEHLVACRL